jgi:hypothetical protein
LRRSGRRDTRVKGCYIQTETLPAIGLGALPAPRPCQPRARPRRAGAFGAGDGRPQRSTDHVAVCAR